MNYHQKSDNSGDSRPIVLSGGDTHKRGQNFDTKQLRVEVLKMLRSKHQGMNGMIANVREWLFWPGLDASIWQTRAQCQKCNSMASSQPRETLMPPSSPDFPFQKMVTDLFDLHGKNYRVYTDWWIKVAPLPSRKVVAIRNMLRSWFYTYSTSEEISSDGGLLFDSFENN